MLKYMILFIVTLIAGTTPALAQNSVSLSTVYPSPSGSYQNLNVGLSTGAPSGSCTEGDLYFRNTGGMWLCVSGGTWQAVGGIWTDNGSVVELSTETTPDIEIPPNVIPNDGGGNLDLQAAVTVNSLDTDTGDITSAGDVTATDEVVAAAAVIDGDIESTGGDVIANGDVSGATATIAGNIESTGGDVIADGDVSGTTATIAGNIESTGGDVIASGDVSGATGTYTTQVDVGASTSITSTQVNTDVINVSGGSGITVNGEPLQIQRTCNPDCKWYAVFAP